VYERRLDGEVLSFGHEGILYRNSFMMYDRGTESLWLHVTGEALKGPMKGKRLKFLAAQVMPWKAWKAINPNTKVLLGEKVSGFMGSFNLKEQIASYGLAVGSGRTSTLFRYSLLQSVPLLNARVDDQPVVINYDSENAYAVCFAAKQGAQELHFDAITAQEGSSEKRALMRDSETGSTWLRMSGTCIAGSLKGQFLEQLPATTWLGKRWMGFYPSGRMVGLE
jgi:hypothetical protein